MKNKKEMTYGKDRKFEILYESTYKDLKYYVVNLGTHPTAYIALPMGHKFYGIDYDDIDVNVHGGLTYSRDYLGELKNGEWFIGWDYAHAYDYIGAIEDFGDKKWTTDEIIEECKNVIDQIQEV